MGRKARLGYMTNTPIRTYLSRGYFAPLEILNKLKEIDALQADNSTTSREIEAMVFDLKKDIDDLRRQYDEVKTHIQKFTLDGRHIQILELRYLRGMSFSDIAKQMGYCCDHVQRQHAKALKSFEEYLNQNNIKYW